MKLAPIFYMNQSWSLGDLSNHSAKPLSLDQLEAHIKDFEDIKRKLALAEARVKELEAELDAAISSVVMIRCTKHVGVPSINKNAFNGGECGACIQEKAAYEVSKITDTLDLMRDEFRRIQARIVEEKGTDLAGVFSSIFQLCDRAVSGIEQQVPVIRQRDVAEQLARRLTKEKDDAEARVKELEEIARLIGSIFYHGNFKAETWNERELESRLKSAGFWFTSTEECLPRDPLDKAMPRKD